MKKKQQIDLLKFCRYYKGEKDCPPEIQDNWKHDCFWRMEERWVNYGIDRQFTMSQCIEFWPETAHIFMEVAKGLPKAVKDGLASYIICAKNLNPYVEALEFLCSYFGLPYKDPREPDSEEEPEPEPIHEDRVIEARFELGIDRTEDYLQLCRYYHGEDECPDNLEGIQTTFWGLERAWIKSANDTRWEDSIITEFLIDFPDGFKDLEIPLGLKAIISDQYQHWCSGKDGVEDYLISYLKNAPKNRKA